MLIRRIAAIHDVIILYIYFRAHAFIFMLIRRIAAIHDVIILHIYFRPHAFIFMLILGITAIHDVIIILHIYFRPHTFIFLITTMIQPFRTTLKWFCSGGLNHGQKQGSISKKHEHS
ncbi:hypothetical protein, partial [Pseudaeromonas pectinilytica]